MSTLSSPVSPAPTRAAPALSGGRRGRPRGRPDGSRLGPYLAHFAVNTVGLLAVLAAMWSGATRGG